MGDPAAALIGFIRHGPTDWNAEKRLSGRSDVALNEAGRAMMHGRRVPPPLTSARWFVSPLLRARQTAALLGAEDATVDPRLIEMHFGAYEGRRLADLRAEGGEAFARNEARGLDFLPPGGESPRMVQQRLRPFLAERAAEGGAHVAVAHKGLMRAVYALATGWDMTAKPADRLQRDCVHLFALSADGRPQVERLNLPLD